MKRRAQSSRCPPGFTLVELLVALSLAVVITALILAAFTTVQTVRRGQADRAACLDTTRRLLQQLANDLERTFVFAPDTNTAFRLTRGVAASNAVLELAFARATPVPGEDDLRWAEVARLTYRLEEIALSNLTLYGLSRPLVGPGADQPPTTNQWFQGLENFDLQLFDGEEWKDSWTGADNPTNPVPHAVRLMVTARRGAARHTATTEVIVPISIHFAPPKKEKSKTIGDIH